MQGVDLSVGDLAVLVAFDQGPAGQVVFAFGVLALVQGVDHAEDGLIGSESDVPGLAPVARTRPGAGSHRRRAFWGRGGDPG